MQRIRVALRLLVGLLLFANAARAEVIRVEILSRVDLPGPTNSEQVTGRAFFAIDPRHDRNKIIVDIDKAPRNSAGKVEFSADFSMQRLKSGSHSGAVIEPVNRGVPLTLRAMGTDFLIQRGISSVALGWQFDVTTSQNVLAAQLPRASDGNKSIEGPIEIRFVLDRQMMSYTVRELDVYAGAQAGRADAELSVQFGDTRTPIAKQEWRLSGNVVTLSSGFQPGLTYELSYRAKDPPIGGLGFVAVRDFATWLKHSPDSLARVTHVHAVGVSQTGRLLRSFLYHGFNTDERRRQVFDGVLVLIAGAAGLDLNARWALPSEGTRPATSFPFSDRAHRDPLTGVVDGVLDNPRARSAQPRIMYANTGAEYWGSRAAALVHTTPDGQRDGDLSDNVRVYFIAGSPHVMAPFPPAVGLGQQKLNAINWIPIARALLVRLDGWVRDDVEPPPSRYPRISDGTLVKTLNIAFPEIPGVASPRHISGSTRIANRLLPKSAAAGAELPMLVPQVDGDGNELRGIRLPDITVPLATYTSWNFRSAGAGPTDKLLGGNGSFIPFALRKQDRGRDPRAAVDERYVNYPRYAELFSAATAQLVKEGYVLAEDASAVVLRGRELWDHMMEEPKR